MYREAGLCVKRTRRKRQVRALRAATVITAANQEWGVDFASDLAANGQSLRILSVVDRHTRQCLRLEVDTSLPSLRVTRALEQIASQRALAAGDSVRRRTGTDLAALSGLVYRTQD